VGGPRGDERRHRPGLGDALLEQLAVPGLAVVKEHLTVDGLVELAGVGVDPDLAEQRLHAEGAGLVGDDGDDPRAQALVADEPRQQPHEGHGRRHRAPARPLEELVEDRRVLHAQRGNLDHPLRDVAAQGPPPLPEVLHFRASLGRPVEGRVRHVLVRYRDAEPRSEVAQLLLVELFLLVGDVAALPGLAEAVALDGPGQDHGRDALGADRRQVGVVHLLGIVAAEAELGELLVGVPLDQLLELRVAAEELLPDEGARRHAVFLALTVDDLVHPAHQEAAPVPGQQGIPVGAPDHLDDVPSRPAEGRLELLDDLAVAAHRAVQAL
jgi:hypothetical protein